MERTETQRRLIADYLNKGNAITPIDALNLFGCFRLSAVVYFLKNEKGMNIHTEMVYEPNGKRHAKYYLVANPKLKAEIKDYMMRGNYLTKEVAEQVFDCKYLNVLIAELKEEGLNIIEERVHPLCGKKFIRYRVK